MDTLRACVVKRGDRHSVASADRLASCALAIWIVLRHAYLAPV